MRRKTRPKAVQLEVSEYNGSRSVSWPERRRGICTGHLAEAACDSGATGPPVVTAQAWSPAAGHRCLSRGDGFWGLGG